jgi:DNA polymerase V
MTYPKQSHGTLITGEILSPKQFPLTRLRRPLFISRVQAGFPSPADDYIETQLDLNELLIPHPASTYFVRVKGHSMKGVGIFSGDILVVDRSLNPYHKAIVVACVEGELCVKRLIMESGRVCLQSENAGYPSLEITEEMEASVWGVVTSVIHKPE